MPPFVVRAIQTAAGHAPLSELEVPTTTVGSYACCRLNDRKTLLAASMV